MKNILLEYLIQLDEKKDQIHIPLTGIEMLNLNILFNTILSKESILERDIEENQFRDKYQNLTNELHSYIQNNLDNITILEKVYQSDPNKIYTEPILYIPYDKFAEYIVLLEYLIDCKFE